jgi:hypothetical protein
MRPAIYAGNGDKEVRTYRVETVVQAVLDKQLREKLEWALYPEEFPTLERAHEDIAGCAFGVYRVGDHPRKQWMRIVVNGLEDLVERRTLARWN